MLENERVRELLVINSLEPVSSGTGHGLVPIGPVLTADPRCRPPTATSSSEPCSRGYGEPSDLDLGHGEQARHEELVAELGLEDVEPGERVAAPVEADLADRHGAPVELFEPGTHPTITVITGTPRARQTANSFRSAAPGPLPRQGA